MLKGQDVALNYFKNFNITNGLSHYGVSGIAKDSKGFVWVSTIDGLNKLDGNTIKKYYSNSAKKNSLPNNYIINITSDSIGYIWIAEYGNGVVRLNPISEKMDTCTYEDGLGRNYMQKTISGIFFDKFRNTIWVSGNDGLYFIKYGSLILHKVKDTNPKKILDSCIRYDLRTDAENMLWIATSKGLLKYNPTSGNYDIYDKIASNNKTPYCTKVFIDNKQNVWAGCYDYSLLLLNKTTNKFISFDMPGPEAYVFNIFQTNILADSNLLFINASAGVFAFDINKKKFDNEASILSSKKSPLQSAVAKTLIVDNELWLGTTNNGLYYYNPSKNIFSILPTDKLYKKPKTYFDELLTIVPDKQDVSQKKLLIGTIGKGLQYLNTANNTLLPVEDELKKYFLKNRRAIFKILQTNNNDKWIALDKGGLLYWNSVDKKITEFNFAEKGLKSDILEVYEDSKHNIWACGRGGILFKAKTNAEFIKIEMPEKIYGDLKLADAFLSIKEDLNSNIWCSASNEWNILPTIVRINSAMQVKQFYNKENSKTTLPEKVLIRNIAINNVGEAVCTTWKGIITWNTKVQEPKFTLHTTTDGLIGNWTNRVVVDKNGIFWITTQLGLSRYDAKTKTFINFDKADGLPMYDLYDISEPSNGNMIYMPVGDHIVAFDITNKALAQNKPTALITSFKVNNELFLDKESGKLIFDDADVDLGPNENNISIEFSILDFDNADKIEYAYKLEGIDKEWQYTNSNTINFNLPYGDYKFLLKAKNSAGIWSSSINGINIYIEKHFYQKWWFIALCILSLIGIVYWLVTRRIKRLKHIYNLKSNIARDLHDEIGSVLTSINILSKISANNIENDAVKSKALLEKIIVQSKDVQNNMSDIVWALKANNETIENTAVKMNQYLAEILDPIKIPYTFNVDEKLLQKHLQIKQHKDFFMIYREVLNNIVKHANCTQVSINLYTEKTEMILSIADNGIGFNMQSSNTGNGLKNIQFRANKINAKLSVESKIGAGTTVKLILKSP